MAATEQVHPEILRSRVQTATASRSLQRARERVIEILLLLAALSSVAITVGIVGVLIFESLQFFKHVSIVEFLNRYPVDGALRGSALWHHAAGLRHVGDICGRTPGFSSARNHYRDLSQRICQYQDKRNTQADSRASQRGPDRGVRLLCSAFFNAAIAALVTEFAGFQYAQRRHRHRHHDHSVC